MPCSRVARSRSVRRPSDAWPARELRRIGVGWLVTADPTLAADDRRRVPAHRHLHAPVGAGVARVLRQVPLRDRRRRCWRGWRTRWSGWSPRTPSCSAASRWAAIPIATVLSSRTGLPALFVRKKAKEYGTCKLAEGPDVAGRRVTLVEDVITTGGAVRDATNALRDAGRDGGGRASAPSTAARRARTRSPTSGLEVRPVLTKADLDAAARRSSRLHGWAQAWPPRRPAPRPLRPRPGAPAGGGGGASTTRRRTGSPRTRGWRGRRSRCSRPSAGKLSPRK